MQGALHELQVGAGVCITWLSLSPFQPCPSIARLDSSSALLLFSLHKHCSLMGRPLNCHTLKSGNVVTGFGR